MTTLDPKAGYVILINTFTVEPSKAEELRQRTFSCNREWHAAETWIRIG